MIVRIFHGHVYWRVPWAIQLSSPAAPSGIPGTPGGTCSLPRLKVLYIDLYKALQDGNFPPAAALESDAKKDGLMVMVSN